MKKFLSIIIFLIIVLVIAGAGIFIFQSKINNQTQNNTIQVENIEEEISNSESQPLTNEQQLNNEQASQSNTSENTLKEKIVYFYGSTCPHCALVERFIEENQIEKKIQLEKKEVYGNRDNAKELLSIAKDKCNLEEDEIGVPFLWNGKECILGDQPIINYFKEKLNIQ